MGEYEKNGIQLKGIQIKNIEELKKHFCIEEVLQYYNNKQLHMACRKRLFLCIMAGF